MSQLAVTTTYLHMLAPPSYAAPTPPLNVTMMQAVGPTVSFYRYLYNTVGAAWLWIDRRLLSDATLGAIVQHPQVEVHVLYRDGVPAGYAELDRRQSPDIELAYFGLIPSFIGQGLGKFMLQWAIHRAWSYQPARFWVHTCTLDHPRALRVYQQAGFHIYKNETQTITNPQALGIL